ncbi:Golgi transport complex subunit 5, putative [Trypanosoma equiperdum]|uniref:Conserved oligomeric Golgi complex subunit 5 n=1 Tax=Trypanosoma equiperdum TaxID=5694 RepID=A0A1G4ICC6_TRYEQ|nr:Golgi transport complex subunit 5, putative [Trypanosoma equiperdum]
MFTDSILMSPDFDEEGYLRYAIHASSCKTEQSRLTSCSAAVREEMHNILTENVEDMLQQVTAASCAQRDAAAVRQAAATLMHSASRLRHTIYEPYHLIKGSITKLRNTNVTLNTLRSVIRFINLTTRLKGLLPDDIVRAARTMREVEELLQAANIAAIDVVRSRMDVVERSATVIRSRAQDMLRRADSRDASNVTTALQCFVALGSASRVISGFMTEQKREVMKTLMRELDIQVIANEINDECTATTSDFDYVGSRTCEVLASHLQAALRATATHTGSVIALWRVLVKKADPVTQIPYLSAVDNPTSVLGDYWHFVTDKLRERLQAIQKRPNFFYAMAGDILRYRSLLVTFLDDVVELLELLDQLMGLDASSNGRPNTSGGGGAGACLPSGVEQLRCMWLSHVTREVNERFGAQIMDRHRERLHGVISRLNSIIPSGGNKPLPNLSVDLQRPQVPAIAHVLDVRSYATLAMRDVMEYQRDPQTLSTVLACTLQCLAGFMQRVTETSMRWPLPPLPSVSSDVNTLQMLHICISNACTQLSMDFAVMLASLPEGEEDEDRGEFVGGRDDMWQSSGGGCDGAGGACCDESAVSTRKLVAERQRKLLEVTINLKKISEKVVRPFFRSVSVLLLDSVSMCVDGACGQEAAGISQLQSQTVHFMSHYYYLFDPQTPTLVDSVRRITDSLIVRLMVAVTLVYPFTKEVREHLTVCLHQVPRVAISFGPSTQGAMGRSTMVLKGQLHQLAMWYNASEEALETPEGVSRAALATLPLVVSRLLLLQRVFRPSAAVGGPSAVMGVTPECFIETIEAAVLDQLCVGNVPEGDLAKRVADNSHAAERLGQVMDAVERCFLMAIEALSGDAAQEATVRWVKQLWVLLDHRQVGK